MEKTDPQALAALNSMLDLLEARNKEGMLGVLLTLVRIRFGKLPSDVEAKLRTITDRAKLRFGCRLVIHVNSPRELPQLIETAYHLLCTEQRP